MIKFPSAIVGLLALLPVAFAADCYGGQGKSKYASYAWDLRAQICGANACAKSDGVRGNNQFCSLSIPVNDGASVELQRNDPSGQYSHCYDAYENILNECLDNGSGSGLSGDPNGKWASGDEWYWITVHNPSDYVPRADDVEFNEEIMFGPTTYSMGLAPGGSTTVNIPEGCYIVVPVDNTVPNVNCDGFKDEDP